MAQRARVDNSSVYAFQANDDTWTRWKELYKSDEITLPCCGGAAVPREHPVSGTRYFSHAPYAARTCLWKATGSMHEDLVREACAVLQQIGWQVDTDLWIGDVAVDIVATNPDTEEHVAVMFETASPSERPDETLIAENAQLAATDLRAVLWFVPAQRYGSLEDAILPLPFQRSEHNAENTIGNVAWLLRTWAQQSQPGPPYCIGSKERRFTSFSDTTNSICTCTNRYCRRSGLVRRPNISWVWRLSRKAVGTARSSLA